RIPGAVVGISRNGALAYLEGVGYRDPDSKAPMMPDALFSIASMTKPMVSAVAMQLVEEGLLLLGDPIGETLPELAQLNVLSGDGISRPAQRAPTVQDLLRHTAGFTYASRGTSEAHQKSPGSSMSASVQLTRSEFLRRLAEAPLLFEPGTHWEYGFSTDVLGLIIERVTGQSLDVALKERLWAPLGMDDTGFDITPEQRPRYATAFDRDPLTGEPQSIHHAEDTPIQWPSGGGGAVSTAHDYLKFLDMMRQWGVSGGQRLLSRKSVAMMTSDHLPNPNDNRIAETMDPAALGYGFGLGFAVRRSAGRAALHGSERDYYWSGVYGTYFWVDPYEELTAVFMAAAPGPIRLRYRQMSRALAYQAIDD
ncbi:MAG: serine hydrolase domain-containing protein, partial [Pseudomonadota bacterium]